MGDRCYLQLEFRKEDKGKFAEALKPHARIDENGAFCVLGGIKEGVYAEIFVGQEQGDAIAFAAVPNVEIVAEEIANLGKLTLISIPMEQAMQMLSGGQ